MEPLPAFELFPDPLREAVFKQSPAPCGFCGLARGWLYDTVIYGKGDISETPCCPWCIHDGTAALKGVRFNDTGTVLSTAGSERMSDADSDLVEHRTPGFNTWQGNYWLMCCGRACIYLGEADSGDLQGRWAGAVPSLFNDQEFSESRQAEILERIERGGSTAAYVFQCRTCGSLKGYWDCD